MNSDEARLADLLRRARALHQRGDLIQARGCYEAILAMRPQHAGAVQLLGVLEGQDGKLESALDLFDRAIAIDPGSAAAYGNRGSALQKLGRTAAALDDLDRAIALNGQYAEAHLNRGVVLGDLGRCEEALASMDRAIAARPDYASAYFNRGDILRRLNRVADAIASYERTVSIRPDFAEAHFNHGTLLLNSGRPEEAVASFSRAIAARPGYAEAHCNCAVALLQLRRLDAALQSCDRALALRPDDAEAHANRGRILFALHQPETALQSCDRAIALRPRFADVYSNRAVVLKELQQWDAALESLDRAIAIKPDSAEAYLNRGVLFHERNHLEEAIASYDKAISLRADYKEAQVNRAMALLLAGDFSQGWRAYEARLAGAGGVGQTAGDRFAKARWYGREPLRGKTILLHGEQGIGDSLQFCRYVPQVAGLAAGVSVMVPASLKTALQSLAGAPQVLADDEPLPEFDLHCPMMSLPFAFDTTLETIPREVPYLVADAAKADGWKEILGAKSKLRVGLVWSGGHRPDQPELWSVNRRRNVPLRMLSRLNIDGIEFYSLQKGQPAESELSTLVAAGWNGPAVIDETRRLHDFSDTAALVEQLDLVISVDTSTAHLAAALGKPVWILNRFDTCWRWLLDRSDSPWYPTVRLYRQEQPGEWEAVIERVRADLAAFAG